MVITGVGPVTALGVGREAFWRALLAGRTNVQRRTLPVDVGKLVELPIAAMPPDGDVPGLARHVEFLTSQDHIGHRDAAYAMLAIELALADSGLSYDRANNAIGVIQVFEAPSVERTVSRLFELMSMPLPTHGPPPVYDLLAPNFYAMQPFVYVHLISKGLGLRGFSTSVHNACSSGAFALESAADRIRSGAAEVMVVAGGEAFETAVRLEWFRRLQLYATTEHMRPFDRDPSGFYVGEGGAAVVLESGEHAAKRGANVYAEYVGGAFAHQGWKQTIPDLRSARLRSVIDAAMRRAEISWGDVNLIVPHGAATMLSDAYERECLTMALGSAGGSVNAVATVLKPYTGHLLAASGVIEVIGLLLAMKHAVIPATLGTGGRTCDFPIPLAEHVIERTVDCAIKLSTGFTGHDAASVFMQPGK